MGGTQPQTVGGGEILTNEEEAFWVSLRVPLALRSCPWPPPPGLCEVEQSIPF